MSANVTANDLVYLLCQLYGTLPQAHDRRVGNQIELTMTCGINGQSYMGVGTAATKDQARLAAATQVMEAVYPNMNEQQWRDSFERDRAAIKANAKANPGQLPFSDPNAQPINFVPNTAAPPMNFAPTNAGPPMEKTPDFRTCTASALLHWLARSHEGSIPHMAECEPEGVETVRVKVTCDIDTYSYIALGCGNQQKAAKNAACENILTQMYPNYSMDQIRGFIAEDVAAWGAAQAERRGTTTTTTTVPPQLSGDNRLYPFRIGALTTPNPLYVNLLTEVTGCYEVPPISGSAVAVNPPEGGPQHWRWKGSVTFMGYNYEAEAIWTKVQGAKALACEKLLAQLYPDYTVEQIRQSLAEDRKARKGK
eukprot:TRINITY_DN68247_c0_g1_i1.p1 TRINITY_DN68247_c0_g1~~TRINITY_DN68247_c0_g1_i1.p1  ORF type:complete len:424 (+),score=16.17 TRINITY_DN68247_c0_g1_i1:177-1274(+)